MDNIYEKNNVNSDMKFDVLDQNKNLILTTENNLDNVGKEIYEKERVTVNSSNRPSSRFTTVDNNFYFGAEHKDLINDSETPLTSERSSKNNYGIRNSESSSENEIRSKKSIYSNTLYTLKIIMLGETNVGKTSILLRYLNNEFLDSLKCTITVENKFKTVPIGQNQYVNLNIWDTAGQEKYRSITRGYYKESQGAIIVFDLTKHESFEKLGTWIQELKDHAPENIEIIIVGNKSDLIKKRVISEDEIKNVIGNKYLYYEVSAKDGNNISLVFEELRNAIIKNLNKENEENEDTGSKENPNQNENKKKIENFDGVNNNNNNDEKKLMKCCS